MLYTDPSGHAIDTFVDLGFLAYDAYRVGKVLYTGCGDLESELIALGLDAVGVALPFVTGLGMAARLGTKADDVLKLMARFDNIDDFARRLGMNTNDAIKLLKFIPAPGEAHHSLALQDAIVRAIRELEGPGDEITAYFFKRAKGSQFWDMLGLPGNPVGPETLVSGPSGWRTVRCCL